MEQKTSITFEQAVKIFNAERDVHDTWEDFIAALWAQGIVIQNQPKSKG